VEIDDPKNGPTFCDIEPCHPALSHFSRLRGKKD